MEQWLPVVGFEGRYEVSNHGRVRSLSYRGHGSVEIMTSTRNYAGYHVVTLGMERRQFRVHCLVLEAFVGPRPEGQQGCHGNDNCDNNQLLNLRWDTPKGNIADRQHATGERNGRSKLTDQQRQEIRSRRLAGEKCVPLSKEFGVSAVRVCQLAA